MQRIDAAVGHVLELLAQQHGLGTGLPGVGDALLIAGQAPDGVGHEVDAG